MIKSFFIHYLYYTHANLLFYQHTYLSASWCTPTKHILTHTVDRRLFIPSFVLCQCLVVSSMLWDSIQPTVAAHGTEDPLAEVLCLTGACYICEYVKGSCNDKYSEKAPQVNCDREESRDKEAGTEASWYPSLPHTECRLLLAFFSNDT